MDFRNFLDSVALEIDQELERIFVGWRREISEVDKRVLKLLEASIQASKGGKRLRGALVKLGYEIAGGSRESQILTAAAAFEIFQTAILAHDDIIDKSPLRRGVPTIYQSLGANHYAISQTICLGDIGFFLAFQLLSESNFSPTDKAEAVKAFSKTMIDTAFGQMLDVELSGLAQREERDVLEIAKFKTARYTVVGPLQLGASLGGGSESLLKTLRLFGENLGIAFQIQDDILGVFGDEKVLGKSVSSDISEGKNTLLIVYALKNAEEEGKTRLKALYGKTDISDKEADEVRKIFKESGALDYSVGVALKYVTAAKKLIPQITKDSEKQKLLEQAADYLVNRNR